MTVSEVSANKRLSVLLQADGCSTHAFSNSNCLNRGISRGCYCWRRVCLLETRPCLKSRFWSGSAAGCEAGLCPAANSRFDVGSALYLGPKPITRGIAQFLYFLYGEAQPRLTSGGRAAPKPTFEARPLTPNPPRPPDVIVITTALAVNPYKHICA